MVFEFGASSVVRDTQVGTAVANTQLTTIDNATTAGRHAMITIDAANPIKIGWSQAVTGAAGSAPPAVTAVSVEDATGFCVTLLAGVPVVFSAEFGKYISHVRINTSGTPVVRVTYFD